MLLTRHNFGVSLKNIYQNDFWERYYICLRKENDIAMWCFIKKNTSIKNDGYWKRTYHDNFLEESMTYLVWKMVMLLAWCYVPRVIFHHTSLMKMWHFYLLENYDILLRKQWSYFERTFFLNQNGRFSLKNVLLLIFEENVTFLTWNIVIIIFWN